MAKLKPRARIIRTIGDKLISGPEAAIIELVKNSYDADSPSVAIKISPPIDGRGKITVRDYGHGMSYSVILNDWLEPATDTKTKNTKSKSGERTVLGAKGVGRFASASLGSKLLLTSVSNDNGILEKTELNLDWNIFESNKYLDDIDIDIIKNSSTDREKTGVDVEIIDLKTIWDKKRITRLIRELRRLATPQYIGNRFDIFLDLSDFISTGFAPYNFDGASLLKEKNKSFKSVGNDDEVGNIKNLILPYSLNDESDYLLKGVFDSDGGFQGEFSIIRGDNIPLIINVPAPSFDSSELSCGSFEISLKLYDLEKDSIEKLFSRMNLKFGEFGVRAAREMISENTGIAIYRSGFRIRPYGEPDNDWLHLEKRRVQNPSKRIGHGQIAGSIHVKSEQDSFLIERSSREGLENNGAFERLTKLVTNLLINIEEKRFSFRAKAGISRKPAKNINKAREIASLDSIYEAVKSLSEKEQRPILLRIEKESLALTKTLDEIEAYQRLLESRAALGMVVAQVVHDGRTYLDPINSSAKSLIENAPFLLEESKKGELVRKYYPTYGEAIVTGAKGLTSLFKSLDPISGRRVGKRAYFAVIDVVSNVINLLDEECIEKDISIDCSIDHDIKAFGYSGDLQSALMNLLQNSIHWLSVSDAVNKLVTIDAVVNDVVNISVKDNGPGINESDVEVMFDAGFSLKSSGHGLGLVIAREACRHSKGDLYFVDQSVETHFVIELPLSE